MKIFLWGFMGSGKSFWLNKLQSALPGDWESFDFDNRLASDLSIKGENLGETIDRIGWQEFRLKEFELYEKTLNSEASGLYALGGGVFTESLYSWNWPCEKREQHLILLRPSLDLCWERVQKEVQRPLVRKGRDEFFNLYEQRKFLYEKASIVVAQNSEIGMEKELFSRITDLITQA